MKSVPTFETNRLILRELVESDAPSYQEQFVDYEVIRHLTASVPWPYPQDGVLNYLRSDVIPNQGKDRWVWAITLKENPAEVIGSVELLREATPTNRGFWLGKSFWGKGYMTEAVEPITNFAFSSLGFEKLLFGNAIGNDRSSRIKEKMGARLVSSTSASYVDEKYSQKEIYELTKEDWLLNQKVK